MIDKPKVGEKVFVRYGDSGTDVLETAVEKVGKKYFTVSNPVYPQWPSEYQMETAIPGYWKGSLRTRDSGRICYRSEDSLKAKLEADALRVEAGNLLELLRKAFDYWSRGKYTLDQLRRIKAIVDEGKETECQS